jgi:hypothetical protein
MIQNTIRASVGRWFMRCCSLAFGLGLIGAATRMAAEDTNVFSLGARSGFSSTDFGDPFWQTEAFATYDWRKPWQLVSPWTLTPRLEGTLGDLSRNGENGFVGTMGPVVVLRYGQFPLVLDAGIRVTILSRMVYDNRDFGYPLQFTSHAGLIWEISSRWQMSYRFQHMSNAGLGSSNPGLNTHMLGVGYRF